jgi:hypothetical protein
VTQIVMHHILYWPIQTLDDNTFGLKNAWMEHMFTCMIVTNNEMCMPYLRKCFCKFYLSKFLFEKLNIFQILWMGLICGNTFITSKQPFICLQNLAHDPSGSLFMTFMNGYKTIYKIIFSLFLMTIHSCDVGTLRYPWLTIGSFYWYISFL